MVQTQPDPVQRFWKLIDEIRAIDARKKALEDELFQLQLQLPEDFDPDDDEVTGRGKSAEE